MAFALNVRQMTERFLGPIHAQLRTLPMSDECAQALKQQRTAFRRTRTAQALSEASRDQRVATYEQVQQWRREGYNISQIARRLDWKWETARNYFYASQFPERKQLRARRSILDPYLSYLEQRYAEGCENASQLWREIKALGYPGTNKQVLRWMQLRRAQPASTTPRPYRETCLQPAASSQSILPSTRQLAWLMVKDPEQLTETERLTLAHIQQETSVAKVYLLTQQFVVMIKQRQVEHLDPWLNDAIRSEIPALSNFAVTLQRDYAAVKAALTLEWSNELIAYCTSFAL